jgi:small subunit ribosomal protein S16
VRAARQRNCWEKTVPVAVKIKLKRLGKIRAPYYRIVVADARTKRDGRAIEEIGKYHPKAEPSFIEVNSERAQHWLSVGAQPTDPVRKILEITGDWQKFKGLPGAEGTLRTAAPKEDKKEIFAAAVKENMGDGAPAPKGKGKSAAKESESSAPKTGRVAAKDAASAKAEKPARAKAAEPPAKAKSGADGDAKASRADAKANDTAGDAAKASTAKDSTAKASGAAKDSTAKDSTAKAGTTKGGKADGAQGVADSDAADAPAAEAAADTAEESADGSAAAAVAADAESASGD